MKTILSKEIKDLGVTESDVKHMLKACNVERATDFEPSMSELRSLLTKAYLEEQKKRRTVVSWGLLLIKLSK